jgi:hypothetical protein
MIQETDFLLIEANFHQIAVASELIYRHQHLSIYHVANNTLLDELEHIPKQQQKNRI